MENKIVEEIGKLLEEVKNKKPLVHNITNYVTVNDCANILLALGASPIMADDIREAADITSISSALVINIGTLNERTIEAMIASGKKANELNIPVVFDPVGAGASEFRNATTKRILEEVKVSVLRGNMSEVKFIAGLQATTKGVDASEADINAANEEGVIIAKKLALMLNCTVAITGVTDIIADGKRGVILENGHKMLANVTGTGCMTTALVGAYCGAGTDCFLAAVSGIISMGIAGEIAFEKAGQVGTGSFHIAIIDAISNLNSEIIGKMAKAKEL
ncbi:hydroxyethylthiazole kinase [Clostridium saccharoperbutylacetonicum]|uniref:Hydroxyethylthiazole kinase n=1 Tax=Clostridium saccharoperbutylacetonicum N1-4(HMT) TaxID=931276 RepID=M1M9J1_9CLOT|nr:hydroxyethylthiazole kinase [Clostridium saccharoperbutylacetonicum]AGF54619.1 hydroxyethylthiazole kinase ThiM [Clostridium saccharoperbutylacetonicum N1-4(HMT)]NRT58860.1 hydroxyethylthiazole kinase [Clostridium saccharoperbutylacetonicum]NSB28049.1 hydroxyethylthiazole kinase [Clostridium saccharoperbutylacetonicum]NSB41535.1 hydroxyethylthiazole kinase [Clostridium saccharoperbutylacetonicum]